MQLQWRGVWPGVCVCRASTAGGNRSRRDLLLERPQQRCWCCSVPRCAQQPPSSAHSSAAKAEAELFGRGGRGTLLRLFLGSLQTEQGCEIVMFQVEVLDLDLGEN